MLAVQDGRGVGVEVNIVRPGLGGQAAAAHCGSPVLEGEAGRYGLHQQSSPALGELEVETVRGLLPCNQELSWTSLGLIIFRPEAAPASTKKPSFI